MNRLTMGAALGGLAVFLFDPESGEERRERLLSFWRDNQAGAVQAGRAVSEAAESARPLARRMTKAVSSRDWARLIEKDRRKASLWGLIGAAAIGGALVYFIDPAKGAERRSSALNAGRSAVQQVATAVRPVVGRVSDQVAGSVASVKAKVS